MANLTDDAKSYERGVREPPPALGQLRVAFVPGRILHLPRRRADRRYRITMRAATNNRWTLAAGNPFRRWPAASFVELVCRLASKDPKRRIILTSGPSDAEAAAAVARDARARLSAAEGEAIVECGEFDLAELRALIGQAALYIGGDSGPLHIAGTTNVPVVGLYGPTLPVRSPHRSAPMGAPSLLPSAAGRGRGGCRR